MEATYISSNSFSVEGLKTDDFIAGRRLKLDCDTDGIKYAAVTSSEYTTVTTVIIDEAVLTSNLVDVLYSPIKPGETGNLPDHTHSNSEGDGGYIAEPTYEFIGLTDTPATYSGSEGQVPISTGSGLEFSEVGKQQVFAGYEEPTESVGGKDNIYIDREAQEIYYREFDSLSRVTSVSAKSVILDIADNYGESSYIGIRSIEFKFEGTLIELGGADVSVYATSNAGSSWVPLNIFNTAKSKTGSASNNSWLSGTPYTASNMRVICVFNTEQRFDEIVINNNHDAGGSTNRGCNNTKIYISSDSITDTTYNATISNSDLIFDGQVSEHTASDVVDDESLTLIFPYPPSAWEKVANFTDISIDASGFDGNLTTSDDTIQEVAQKLDDLPIQEIFSGTSSPGTVGEINDYYVNETDQILYKKKTEASAIIAKTVIVDIADNWGNSDYTAIRAIDLTLEGSTVETTTTYYTAYDTSHFSTYGAEGAFDSTMSKNRGSGDTYWLSANGSTTNQRLICVYDTNKTFDGFNIVNFYDGNTSHPSRGARNIKIYTTSETYTDTTYGADVGDLHLALSTEIQQQTGNTGVIQSFTATPEGTGWYSMLEGAGAKNFLDLEDTPTTYSGGQYLRTTSSGIEAIDGIILKSPDQTEWLLGVTNSGTLTITEV